MTAILLYIKHHCPWVWGAIEWLNGWLFGLLYGDMDEVAARILAERSARGLELSLVKGGDIAGLALFLQSQPGEYLRCFAPHDFDEGTLARLLRNRAFLMMKASNGAQGGIVGYFFLRCFFVGRAFHGFLVGKGHEGAGIGAAMMACNAAICARKGLRLFSTVSEDNVASRKASERVSDILTAKRLGNGYMLIEWGAKAT